MKKIGKSIKETRKILGMTQEEFASLIGITQGTLSKWEHGEFGPVIRSFWMAVRKAKAAGRYDGD